MIDVHTVGVTLLPAGHPLTVLSGNLTLDETWEPYAQASWTVELPIDPNLLDLTAGDMQIYGFMRRDFRTQFTLTQLTGDMTGNLADWTAWVGGRTLAAASDDYTRKLTSGLEPSPQLRRFRLNVTGITTDHKQRTATITAASGEALLQHRTHMQAEPIVFPGEFLNPQQPIYPYAWDSEVIVSQLLNKFFTAPQLGSNQMLVGPNPTVSWAPDQTAASFLSSLEALGQLDGVFEMDFHLWCDELEAWRTNRMPLPLTPTFTIDVGDDAVTNITETIDYKTFTDTVILEATLEATPDTTSYAIVGGGRSVTTWPVPFEKYPSQMPRTLQELAEEYAARLAGRGREITTTSINDYTVTPTHPGEIQLDQATLTGRIRSVAWWFPQAEMDVTFRDLKE